MDNKFTSSGQTTVKRARAVVLAVIVGLIAGGVNQSWGQNLVKARACFLKGDWEGQANELQGYLVAHPKDIDALFSYAFALSQLKRHLEAINAYSTVVRLYPNHYGGWQGRAEAYFAVGN